MKFELEYAAPPAVVTMPQNKRKKYVKRMSFMSGRPAATHKDALVCAGGIVTSLVYGEPYDEKLVFSHEELYAPKWKNPPKAPEIAAILPEVRRMLREGKYREVPGYVIREIEKDPIYNTMMRVSPDGKTRYSIQPRAKHIACIMELKFENGGEVNDYLRIMNMESGEATVRFENVSGQHIRRSFVSRDDNVAVLHIGRGLSAENRAVLSLKHEKLAALHEWDGLGFCDGLAKKVSYNEESNTLLFEARYPGEFSEAGFVVAVKVAANGKKIFSEDMLDICANGDILLVTAVDRYDDMNEENIAKTLLRLSKLPENYDELLGRSVSHKAMMDRSSITLCEEKELYKTVEELMEEELSSDGISAALLEKLYHMGRCFLIGDTGKLPPSRGQYNINVNLQVCSGNLTGLPEMMDVFFRFFEERVEDFRENAQRIFGARGIMASIHPDIDGGRQYHFSGPWPHEYWVSCAGWVLHEFWNHYLCTADDKFLRSRLYPLLKETALFFEDYLSDTDENGRLIFYPCFSPENGQARGYPITVNAVMDIFVAVEVLENLLSACHILGIKEEKEENWQKMLSQMPILLTDAEGALKEWARSDIAEDYDHRHVSHHYGVWPSRLVTPAKTPQIAEAVLRSNHRRAQENDSAHGIVHRLFSAIRLKDREGAFDYYRQLLDHGFLNYSMMTNHFPYKAYFPDAVGAFPAALIESFVYSEPGFVEFLPCLPRGLEKGSIKGVKLFSFMSLDEFEWDAKSGQIRAAVTSLKNQKIDFTVGGAKITGCEIIRRDSSVSCLPIDVTLNGGEQLELLINFNMLK